MTGGGAAAEALRQINPDVMPVYPITPQTPIIQTFTNFQAKRLVDTEIITAESEHSVMSACVGASAAGARTVTATSSQGLALMNEVLYVASGLQLPIFMLVSARALSAPLNIHGDHSDVMGARDAGWVQIFSENAQESYDNTLIGLKLAEAISIPVITVMDGFITSHSVENLEILEDKVVQKFIGEFQPDRTLLDTRNPVSYGMLGLPDSYFEFKIDQDKAILQAVAEFQKIAGEFAAISGRKYDLFESYQLEDAEQVMVIIGSTAGTAKEVVDKLRGAGQKVGLLKIKLFRPFPHAEIAAALKNAKNIAVLDRTMSFGTTPPLYQEIVASLYQTNKNIRSYVYGLGGRDIFQKDLEQVFKDLESGAGSGEINYLGAKSNE